MVDSTEKMYNEMSFWKKEGLTMSLKHYQEAWTEFGKRDPLWAVLTEEHKKERKWDIDEFFRNGREEINAALRHIETLGPNLSRNRALDFGCGVGRLAQALADHFKSVVGVDISSSMIAHAERLNRFGNRVRYLHNPSEDLKIFPDASFDFIYSSITLQHMAPAFSRRYIREFIRLLNPGGMLVFQLPCRPAAALQNLCYRFARRPWYAYRKYRAGVHPIMEMHGIPKKDISALLSEEKVKPLSFIPDQRAGKKWVSLKYYVLNPRYNLTLLKAERPVSGEGGSAPHINVLMRNDGKNRIQKVAGNEHIKLGARLYPADASNDTPSLREFRRELPDGISAGERISIPLVLDLDEIPAGRYRILIDLVHENRYWFHQIGFHPLEMVLTIPAESRRNESSPGFKNKTQLRTHSRRSFPPFSE